MISIGEVSRDEGGLGVHVLCPECLRLHFPAFYLLRQHRYFQRQKGLFVIVEVCLRGSRRHEDHELRGKTLQPCTTPMVMDLFRPIRCTANKILAKIGQTSRCSKFLPDEPRNPLFEVGDSQTFSAVFSTDWIGARSLKVMEINFKKSSIKRSSIPRRIAEALR